MAGEYEEWQSLLSATFLLPHNGPTLFFIDDSELARLRPDVKDPAGDLAEAVCSRLRLADGRSMFSTITADYRQWERGPWSEAPPVLPAIAITVLAATRMRSDAEARSTNYYLRLAQALSPGASASSIGMLRNDLGVGGAFLDVVEMWRGLHAWIEAQDGYVGTSTIRDHPHLQRIGYPLSQALVRQSDRLTLTRFFHALDFDSGSVPAIGVILGALDIWTAAAQNSFSESFMRALRDTDIRPLLAAVVEALAQAWDGRVLTSDGMQRIAMCLSIDLEAWKVGWLFPVPPGKPEALTLITPDGEQRVGLTLTAGSDYYSVMEEATVNPELLLSGVRFRGSEFTAEFPALPVIFLRPDPQTGAWSSVAGMLPFEEHLVIISGAYVADFRQALHEAAVEGWRLIPQRGVALVPGYAMFERVRFMNGQALELALSRLPRLRHIGVAPATVPRARLVRGLPITTSISATHYLIGGEPDLLLPFGPDPRLATVALDGRREQLQANGFPLELRRFLSGLGRHIVYADEQELVFTTLDEGPDPARPPGTAALGWTSNTQMGGSDRALVVVGALVTEMTSVTPMLARRGRDESWLLHDDGRTERLAEPAPPGFLASIDIGIHSPCFEISAPASALWLAQRRDTRWHLTEIGPANPKDYDLHIDVLDAWKRACRDSNGAQLWALQLSMAKGTT